MKQILLSLLVTLGLTACNQQTPLEKIDSLFKSAAEANHTEWTPEQWSKFYTDTYLALAEFYEANPSFEEHNELIELTRSYGEIFERDASRHLWPMNIWGDLNVWVDSKTQQFIGEDPEWLKAGDILGKATDKWAETHYGKGDTDLTEDTDEELIYEEEAIEEIIKNMTGEELVANETLVNVNNSKNYDENRVFNVAEEMPQFKGGDGVMMDYINKNIVYPTEAKEKGILGRVVCTFTVERDGSISDIKVVKSVDPLLDKEAIRLIQSMPKWKPGKQGGKTVRVKYTLPVTFR